MLKQTLHVNPGIHKEYLVDRHLKTVGIIAQERQALVNDLKALPGVAAIELDPDQEMLHATYDASKNNLDEIEAIVRSHGGDIADDWWTHAKEGWYKFTDQNVHDNAFHVPHCCNKSPK